MRSTILLSAPLFSSSTSVSGSIAAKGNRQGTRHRCPPLFCPLAPRLRPDTEPKPVALARCAIKRPPFGASNLLEDLAQARGRASMPASRSPCRIGAWLRQPWHRRKQHRAGSRHARGHLAAALASAPAMNALPRSGATSRKAASWTISYPSSAANRWIRALWNRMVRLALAASAISLGTMSTLAQDAGKAQSNPAALHLPRLPAWHETIPSSSLLAIFLDSLCAHKRAAQGGVAMEESRCEPA